MHALTDDELVALAAYGLVTATGPTPSLGPEESLTNEAKAATLLRGVRSLVVRGLAIMEEGKLLTTEAFDATLMSLAPLPGLGLFVEAHDAGWSPMDFNLIVRGADHNQRLTERISGAGTHHYETTPTSALDESISALTLSAFDHGVDESGGKSLVLYAAKSGDSLEVAQGRAALKPDGRSMGREEAATWVESQLLALTPAAAEGST